MPGYIKETSLGEMVVFEFMFGPIHFGCLVNIPQDGEEKSTVYVKIDLRWSKSEWELWKKKDTTNDGNTKNEVPVGGEG